MAKELMKLPIVLIPGLMCDMRLFKPQISFLSRDRTVVSASPYGFNTVEAIAKNIIKSMPKQFILVGLSLGGIVAIEIARLCQEKIHKLILMDTSYLAEPEHISIKRESQIRDVEKGNLKTVMVKEHIPNYLADGSTSNPISDLCIEMALQLGSKIFVQQSLALMSRKDQTNTLKNIEIPTMLLCGEYDRLCNVKIHQKMHDLIYNSSLNIVNDAGHLPTLENPLKTNRILKKWLD